MREDETQKERDKGNEEEAGSWEAEEGRNGERKRWERDGEEERDEKEE